MRFAFNLRYLLLAATLFLIELAIALFVKDSVIRPFVGDVLVVCLIYCLLRILLQAEAWKIALGVLLFAFVIEILQYFDYVKLFGLENNRFFSVVLGRTFEGSDFFAYSIGFLLIVLSEQFWRESSSA